MILLLIPHSTIWDEALLPTKNRNLNEPKDSRVLLCLDYKTFAFAIEIAFSLSNCLEKQKECENLKYIFKDAIYKFK